jgi:hypothetical protein
VRQPWAWLIFFADPLKDIENRDWKPSNPDLKHRGLTAIHTSGKVYRDEYDSAKWFVERRGIEIELPAPGDLVCSAIIGIVDIVDCVTQSSSPWFVGEHGFVLVDPKPLTEPIRCGGMLGFWDVPVEILQRGLVFA